MPRLIPKKEVGLVRATRTVDPQGGVSLRAVVYRGEVRSADDPYVKAHPDSFEPVEPVTRGGAPPAGEPVAIARAHFVAFDGGLVWANQRFQAHDEIVRHHPGLFYIEVPRD